MSAITYSIHIANTESGDYDVHLPLPKPFHVNEYGLVVRHDTEEGSKILGFMETPEPGKLSLYWGDFEAKPSSAVGKYVVLSGIYGSLSSFLFPVTQVTIS